MINNIIILLYILDFLEFERHFSILNKKTNEIYKNLSILTCTI